MLPRGHTYSEATRMAGDATMRKLVGFILIIGAIGTLNYSFRTTDGTQVEAQKQIDTLTKADKLAPLSLGTPTPQSSAQKKTDTNTQTDAENIALVLPRGTNLQD